MFNPFDEVHRGRLRKKMEHDHRSLSGSRKTRHRLIRDYAGTLYAKMSGTLESDKIPDQHQTVIGMMREAAQAHVLTVAANRPQYMVQPLRPSVRQFANIYEMALNRLTAEIHLLQTLQQVAFDSFFGLGIVQVSLADSPAVELDEDVWVVPGRPFARRISEDDYLFDVHAPHRREVQYESSRYTIAEELLFDDPFRFDTERAERALKASNARREAKDSIRSLSRKTEEHRSTLEEMVDLVETYHPREGLVCTWLATDEFSIRETEPLSVIEWDGREEGPYHVLNNGPVPDQILPASDAASLKFVFDGINSAYSKIIAQARRQKEVMVGMASDEEDAKRLTRASDGDVTMLDNPQALNTVRFGGPDANVMGFVNNAIAIGDRLAGNLSARLGLGPSADTLGQDRLINQQVSRREQFAQMQMIQFAKEIGEHLGTLLFDDPIQTFVGTTRVPGTDIEVESVFDPFTREGRPSDFSIQVEAYSMPYRSPAEQAQVVQMMMNQMGPFLPLMQRQGMQLDLPRYLEIMADLMHVPQLKEIIRTGPTPTPEQVSQPMQGANTGRQQGRPPSNGQPQGGLGAQPSQPDLQDLPQQNPEAA